MPGDGLFIIDRDKTFQNILLHSMHSVWGQNNEIFLEKITAQLQTVIKLGEE